MISSWLEKKQESFSYCSDIKSIKKNAHKSPTKESEILKAMNDLQLSP